MDPRRSPQFADRPSYFLVALFGAVLGIMVALAAAPYIFSDVLALPPLDPPAPEAEDGGDDEPDTSLETEPELSVVDLEESVKKVVRQVGPSVVSVINQREISDMWGRHLEQDSQGSGVMIDEQGHVVTNYHVVEGARDVIVEDHEGREYQVEIVGEDPATDLAVLRIDTDTIPAASFGDSDAVEIGQLAIAIGNPLGREFARSVTMGIVSGIRSTMYGQAAHQRVFELIQTDASINPGNSGGALLDSHGRIIGINTLKFASPEVEGMGFAIPANTVERIVDQIIEHGRVQRAWMGMTGLSVQDAVRQGVNIPGDVEEGVYVDTVLEGSPAWDGGLRSGDVIVEADEKPMADMVAFLVLLEDTRPGHTMPMEVIRDGEQRSIEITLGTMPE